jgi:hypothetical protein
MHLVRHSGRCQWQESMHIPVQRQALQLTEILLHQSATKLPLDMLLPPAALVSWQQPCNITAA